MRVMRRVALPSMVCVRLILLIDNTIGSLSYPTFKRNGLGGSER